jgi:hypothetical protein
MDDRALADLGPDERKLLAIFARYGRDGRAITTVSLMAHAGFGLDRKRLSETLGKLAERGLVTQGGDDPFIGAPVAYRLVGRCLREARSNIRRKRRDGKRSIDSDDVTPHARRG